MSAAGTQGSTADKIWGDESQPSKSIPWSKPLLLCWREA